MEKDAYEIRREIEETRERMGETVEALADKADAPARAKDAVHDRVDSVKQAVSDAVDATQTTLSGVAETVQSKVHDTVGHARPPIGEVGETVGTVSAGAADTALNARRKLLTPDKARAALGGAAGLMQENLVGFAFGALGIGFLVGSLIRVSAVEREQIGPIAEKLRDSAKGVASDLVDQGKAAVTQAVSDAFSGKASKPGNPS